MLRVGHYLNQFFAGVGAEEHANHPPEQRDGAVGPGRALQGLLKDEGRVVSTLVCGDNFFNERADEAHAAVRAWLDAARPDVVVAGPAFAAGRYGSACAQVCRLATEAGVPAVTAMHPENPGLLLYRQAYVVPTGNSAAEMGRTLGAMLPLVRKLGGGARSRARRRGRLPAARRAAARRARCLGRRARGGHARREAGRAALRDRDPGGCLRRRPARAAAPRPPERHDRAGDERRDRAAREPGPLQAVQRHEVGALLACGPGRAVARRVRMRPRRVLQPDGLRQPEPGAAARRGAGARVARARSAGSSTSTARRPETTSGSSIAAAMAPRSPPRSSPSGPTACSSSAPEGPAIVAGQRSARRSSGRGSRWR